MEIPGGEDEKEVFAHKLIEFGVSLKQYRTALEQDEITM